MFYHKIDARKKSPKNIPTMVKNESLNLKTWCSRQGEIVVLKKVMFLKEILKNVDVGPFFGWCLPPKPCFLE